MERPLRQIPFSRSNVQQSNRPSETGMTPGDIYYILFRNKWKILCCSVLGLLVSVTLYLVQPVPFQSDAKLFIRYVITEGKALGLARDDATTKSPDQRGETIMDSEVEILTSLDLAKQVAEIVGPEKILAKIGGGKDLNRAAALIRNGMTVEVPPRSSVIHVAFRHPDSAIVQPVLVEIIDRYLKMHVEIHRAVGLVGDFLTQETDQLRSRLAQTESELRKATNKAGVISLDDSKKAYAEQAANLRQEIFRAQADLAERSAMLQQVATAKGVQPAQAAGAEPAPPSDYIDRYRGVISRLDLLRNKEQTLLTQFTEENSRVKEVRSQLAEAENDKKKIESEHPNLLGSPTPPSSLVRQPTRSIDIAMETAGLNALQAKIKVLNSQLEEIRTEASNLDQMEVAISELRRRKELEEANYRYYSATLEQSRINEALGTGRVSNISQIQSPSPPSVDPKKFYKILAGIACGGVVAGLGWAVLIELYLDRTGRRPKDIEKMARLPLFLSIPDFGKNGHRHPVKTSFLQKIGLKKLKNGTADKSAVNGTGGHGLVYGKGRPDMHPFHETLRDRLIGYFESRNLTHKPKLVSVTGLGKNAGVTTIATGLAACLSETGDGNVLLVDLTPGQGSAQQFYRGKAICGLDEMFSTRDNAQIQDKLFVVSGGNGEETLSRVLPQQFMKLVSKLKASNFDYIIFDMPPVSQISLTPRLAGFMDIVLMVIESEKTDQHIVERATTLLTDSNAHVGAVLNKTRTYVPESLHQESLSVA